MGSAYNTARKANQADQVLWSRNHAAKRCLSAAASRMVMLITRPLLDLPLALQVLIQCRCEVARPALEAESGTQSHCSAGECAQRGDVDRLTADHACFELLSLDCYCRKPPQQAELNLAALIDPTQVDDVTIDQIAKTTR